MDQGQGLRPVPRRVATGYFSLIFFIVLCLILVGGYVPLVLQLQEKSQDLSTLNARMKESIEGPLAAKDNALPTEELKEGVALRYGTEFFTRLADLAQKGVDYSRLANLVGWGRVDTVIQDIEGRLASIAPKQANLKELIDYLDKELNNTRSLLKASRDSLREAAAARDAAIGERDDARKKFEEQVKTLQRRIDDERAGATAQINQYKTMWEAANDARKKTQAELDAAQTKHQQETATLQSTIDKLNDEIERIRKSLAAEKAPPKPGPIGKVLRTDLVNRFTIIDRGERDGIQEGQQLLIYRPATQGKQVAVGKVIVVKVFPTSSRADIVTQDERNPILRDDIVYIQPPEQPM